MWNLIISTSEAGSDATTFIASSSCEQSENDEIQRKEIETSPKTTLKDISLELSSKTVSVSYWNLNFKRR